MHRNGRFTKSNERRKSPGNKQAGRFGDEYADEQDLKHGRQGRKQWQQERHLIKQLDPEVLDDYLLDNG